MEKNLMIERTKADLAGAKAEGEMLARLAKMTVVQRQAMTEGHMTGASVSAMVRR